ncbi:hypothetical protein OG455_39030 [Kitasatospora sp. NBC_01287]|uniref:hypothetical protein n=1 Tax=Kitasatospora sp. NBC_01287 TaxID=2903573 RepID=UPI0022572D1C|nr:hypothetical protein [Kitasatospora sp. NBC_01287]MCX4751430.1 hypothetical protein [Kitasatospora sp. NBC_01287]
MRDRFNALDRTATAIENVVFIYTPVPDLLTLDEREAAERAANARVANEVPGYSDTLPSMLEAA